MPRQDNNDKPDNISVSSSHFIAVETPPPLPPRSREFIAVSNSKPPLPPRSEEFIAKNAAGIKILNKENSPQANSNSGLTPDALAKALYSQHFGKEKYGAKNSDFLQDLKTSTRHDSTLKLQVIDLLTDLVEKDSDNLYMRTGAFFHRGQQVNCSHLQHKHLKELDEVKSIIENKYFPEGRGLGNN